jgi:hypothetical protein
VNSSPTLAALRATSSNRTTAGWRPTTKYGTAVNRGSPGVRIAVGSPGGANNSVSRSELV